MSWQKVVNRNLSCDWNGPSNTSAVLEKIAIGFLKIIDPNFQKKKALIVISKFINGKMRSVILDFSRKFQVQKIITRSMPVLMTELWQNQGFFLRIVKKFFLDIQVLQKKYQIRNKKKSNLDKFSERFPTVFKFDFFFLRRVMTKIWGSPAGIQKCQFHFFLGFSQIGKRRDWLT